LRQAVTAKTFDYLDTSVHEKHLADARDAKVFLLFFFGCFSTRITILYAFFVV